MNANMTGGLMAPKAAIPPQQGAEEDQPDEAANEREMQQYQQLIGIVVNAIHGDGSDDVLNRIKAGKDKLPETIGEIIGEMVFGIEQLVMEKGGRIDDPVKIEIGMEIGDDLVDVASAAGLIGESEEEQATILEEAVMHGISEYGDQLANAGLVDRKEALGWMKQLLEQGDGGPFADQLIAQLEQYGGDDESGDDAEGEGVEQEENESST